MPKEYTNVRMHYTIKNTGTKNILTAGDYFNIKLLNKEGKVLGSIDYVSHSEDGPIKPGETITIEKVLKGTKAPFSEVDKVTFESHPILPGYES